jgi:hypothetical protein
MCVQVVEVRKADKDMTVWKVMKRADNGGYKSPLFDAYRGTQLGEKMRAVNSYSSGYGVCCFPMRKYAKQWKERGERIIRCKIKAGTGYGSGYQYQDWRGLPAISAHEIELIKDVT